MVVWNWYRDGTKPILHPTERTTAIKPAVNVSVISIPKGYPGKGADIH